MASAVDAVVDEGEALGGVVDKYFSFIYEEPTDDAFSDVEESVIDSAVGHGSFMEDTFLTTFPDDPTYQNMCQEEDNTSDNDCKPDSTDLEAEQGVKKVNTSVAHLQSENLAGRSPQGGGGHSLRHDLGSLEKLNADEATSYEHALKRFKNDNASLDGYDSEAELSCWEVPELMGDTTTSVGGDAPACMSVTTTLPLENPSPKVNHQVNPQSNFQLNSHVNSDLDLSYVHLNPESKPLCGLEAESPQHGSVMTTSQPQHGPVMTMSPPQHGSVMTTSPPQHGPVMTTSQPQHSPVITTSPPQHGPVMTTSPPQHGSVMTTSPPQHGPVMTTSPPQHSPVMTTSSPQHGPVMTTPSDPTVSFTPEAQKETSPEPQPNTVTPILLFDNSHSIYVSGDAQDRNTRATAVYLNAKQDRSCSYVVPCHDSSSAVTIKINPDDESSVDNVLIGDCDAVLVSEVGPDAFGRFLEEMQKPYKSVAFSKCEQSGARVNLHEEMHKPFVTGDFGEVNSEGSARYDSFGACGDGAVLDIEAIECDILDELFEGIIKKEANSTSKLLKPEEILVHDGIRVDGDDCGGMEDSGERGCMREPPREEHEGGSTQPQSVRQDFVSTVSELEYDALDFMLPEKLSRPHTPKRLTIPIVSSEQRQVVDGASDRTLSNDIPRERDGLSGDGSRGEGPVAPAIESDDVSAAGNSDHENTGGDRDSTCSDTCFVSGSTGEQHRALGDHSDDPASPQSITQDLPSFVAALSVPSGEMATPSDHPLPPTSPVTCSESEDCSWHEIGAVGGAGIWRPDKLDATISAPNTATHNADIRDFEADCESDEDSGTGLVAAVSRVVRRSMRRMRRLRLSGRGSHRRRHGASQGIGVSEETEVRRALPPAPPVGLSAVRSPAAASIIVTSLMAALAPPPLYAPRETLEPPPGDTLTRSEREMTRGPEGVIPWRRRRRSRHRRVASMGSHDPPSDPTTPTAPMSLEVEVGGYLPTGPRSLDLYAPSAPPSMEVPEGSWEAAAVIPRPSLASRRSSTGLPSEAPSGGEPSRGATHRRRSDHATSDTNNNSNNDDNTAANTQDPGSSERNDPDVHNSTSYGSDTSVNGEVATSNGEAHHRTVTVGNGRNSADGNRNGGNSGENSNSDGNNTNGDVTEGNNRRSEVTNRNNTNSEGSSRNTADNEENRSSSEGNATNGNRGGANRSNGRNGRQSPRRNGNTGPGVEAERLRMQGGTWSHNHSGLMASLAVTVTTFNISRFAVLGARFGWPFVVQWVVVSAVLGLPLMTFHVTVGQYLGAGVVDMWRISPIFQGVGYSLVVAQALVGLYCCVPIAWLFIFFRDSFITHNNMFRWADCRLVNCSVFNNFSTIIIEGVPKYFNSQVLQRGDGDASWLQELGSLKFDMAFNIALIWIITLIALSRGNQSYGKVCYIVFLVPLLCYLVVCLYLASWTKDDLYINDVTNFSEFFMNSRSWMAASREVFLVWGFHGAVLQQMAAHNKRGHALYRDTTILSVITTLVLVLAAVTGSSCVSGLLQNNLHYKPSSFENLENAQFLTESKVQHKMIFETFLQHLQMGNLSPQYLAEYMHHDNFYAGIRIRPPKLGNVKRTESDERSGYQSLRLATELFPALLAVNGAQQISPFWSSLFYLSLLLFGIAQQLAVWRTVVEAVIRINRERLQAWETFITFLCCLFGFSAALPMATGAGINILYFLDYVVSCGWWLMIIQLVQIFALLFVRGKPYSGQDIVSELMGNNEQCRALWLGPLTSFAWNIIVPVGLLVLSISSFKSGQYREVFAWGSDSYWQVWACQLASALQLFPILLVPLVGLIQTCRYLAATDDDLFERIQLLYRPTLRQRTSGNGSFLSVTEESDLDGLAGLRDGQDETGTVPAPRPYSDPPPKYTPPPSYSTATGVRFAKLLNQSFRQSMRRLRYTLRNGSEDSTHRDADGTPQEVECGQPSTTAREATPYIPPPDYVTVITECSRERSHSSTSNEAPPRYSTLDPLRRQEALAALANAASSSMCIKTDDETELPLPTAPSLHRNNSLRRSGLRRSIASGVRRSARRLAATLGVGSGEDGATLVGSEASVNEDNQSVREVEPSHPYAYTNFELVSHSHA
ncbi:uncharacterized protein bdg [Procambarus clarkii]|uniref:uncharacterized protein bdg n=1 Tax=Procambarus clarkii TaxID=6728 RepID=UPI00374463D7